MDGRTTTTRPATACLLGLDEDGARAVALCGSKAAALATAATAGVPVLPGFVVTTEVHRRFLDSGRALPGAVLPDLRTAWTRLTADGAHALVVRSSSTVEDSGSSSMAGRFRSVLDVRGWDSFVEAVTAVLRSADEVDTAGPSPMAVLVQRLLAVDRGGVMFGVDPVTGDRRHRVVEAVTGGPDALVSGRVTAQHYVTSPRGRLLSLDHQPHRVVPVARHRRALLSARDLHRLAGLAAQVERVFGGPQDVEWAIDGTDRLVLLQSRPVTAAASGDAGTGPVLGPGPIAETFPDPLTPVEADLWLAPLRDGVTAALRETRAVAAGRLRRSPVVVAIRGRVAADLELFGYVRDHRRLAALDPRPGFRRLAAAWHVGVMRAELPAAVTALVQEVDGQLAAVDPAGEDGELLRVLDDCAALLRRLHRAEVLAGTLLPPADRTAAAHALAVLADHRADAPDDELVRRHPILLSLVPPAVGRPVTLPPAPPRPAGSPPGRGGGGQLGPREALRLRVRWVQELGARVTWELGRRLANRGVLADPAAVALLGHDELVAAVRSDTPAPDLRDRRAEQMAEVFAAPLPARFRLTPGGDVVAAERRGARPGGGVGAGGGRGTGPVAHGSTLRPPAPGDVLVVRELQPGLAAWLPGLNGLVAETGSTLSHLAILAREYGVPTVVAVHDALHRLPAGTRVVVDGSTGEVEVVGAREASS
jgi:pyruvate,water dikinase